MNEKKIPENIDGFTKTLHIGFTIAGSIALFVFLGIRLDENFNTGSIFTLIGFFWGIIGSNLYVYFKYFKSRP
ncbi:MAG: AtpZ/AtpI family protein [Spirochaetes bacterium]|nr:AtpZ/AtpI family protein [Spirochaetota bacterium]